MLSKSKVKYIQSLGQKKFRQQEGVFIAEGPKLVLELIATVPGSIVEIYAQKEWIGVHSRLLGPFTYIEVSEQELEKVSQLSTPNEVLAVIKNFDAGEITDAKNELVLALDDIRDPGNLGTIIRIADWFGIKQIVCSEESAELYNPKVVQSTMGSIARVKVVYTNLCQWLLTQKEAKIYAAVLDGQDITRLKKISNGIILIGNESKGINQDVLELANEKITITRKGSAESLNAAVAAGIILSHLIPTIQSK